jgi:hypothetical protein
MACEALATLGHGDRIGGWADWFVANVGPGPAAVEPTGWAEGRWREALGDYRRLPEWLGFFGGAVVDDGWRDVVGRWVPRLVPALSTALFHGAIRTAHAVRAVDGFDSPARRGELARSLAYWAARYRPGPEPVVTPAVDDVRRAVTEAAARGARHYVARPTIVYLHGVTGAMAVELLVDHLSPEDGSAALAQLEVDHARLYAGGPASGSPTARPGSDHELVLLAATGRDAHQVKLVEACRRGLAITGDPVFLGAASRATHPA